MSQYLKQAGPCTPDVCVSTGVLPMILYQSNTQRKAVVLQYSVVVQRKAFVFIITFIDIVRSCWRFQFVTQSIAEPDRARRSDEPGAIRGHRVTDPHPV